METTVVILKPDALRRKLVGRIIQRIEDAGFLIVDLGSLVVTPTLAAIHYADITERHGNAVYQRLCRSLIGNKVITMRISGVNAVAAMRKLCGATEPSEAFPGTIRGDFSTMTIEYASKKDIAIENLIHASANRKDAAREREIWFE